MSLDEWVANEMSKRMNRILGHSINLEMLDFEFFREENDRGYFFKDKEENIRWLNQFAKDIEVVEDTLEFMNGVSRSELKTLEECPDEFILLIINHIAAEIIIDNCDGGIPWESPSVWTKELIKSTGLKKYLS